MTPDELRAIRERAEAATPGEWLGTANSGVVTGDGEATVFETGCGCCTERNLSEADATFIAHARTDVPALLDEVERLRRHVCDFELGLDAQDQILTNKYNEVVRLLELERMGRGQLEGWKDGLERERNEARAEVERLTRELQVERCGVRPVDEQLQRVTTDRDELHVAWKREREEVERLTRERDEVTKEKNRLERIIVQDNFRRSHNILKGIHGALTDGGCVVPPLDSFEVEETIRNVCNERDELLVRVANADAELRATREAYNDAMRQRDEARAIANAAVRELNEATARACMADQLSGKPGGFES